MALGLTTPVKILQDLAPAVEEEAELRMLAVALPILLSTIGLAVSIVGIFITRMLKDMPPARVLRLALILPPFLVSLAAYFVLPKFGIGTGAVWALAAGAAGGAAIGLITDYYTSMGPIERIAKASLTGPGTNVISGLAVGIESVAIPILTLCIVGAVSNHYLGLYGIAAAMAGSAAT